MVIAAMAIAAMVTGGPAILSAQTVESPAVQGADAKATANEVEVQRRFSELRRELLDDRADTINWWLAATAIFLTLIGVVIPIVGAIAAYIGFSRFQRIEEEARQSAEAAADHVKEIKKHREQAEEHMRRLRNITAEEVSDPDRAGEIGEAVQEVRRNPDASLLDRAIAEAFALQQGDRIEEAIDRWRSIANVAEGFDNDLAAGAWFSIGYLLQEGGVEKAAETRARDAIDAYNRAIFLQPNNASAYSNRGSAKNKLDRHEDAIADYDQAIRLKPDLAIAYSNRGATKSSQGQHDQAITDCEQAIFLQPNYASPYVNRGSAKSALGHYDEAIADYDQALRLKPSFAEAYNNRGEAKAALGRITEARSDFETALALAQEAGDDNLKAEIERQMQALDNTGQ